MSKNSNNGVKVGSEIKKIAIWSKKNKLLSYENTTKFGVHNLIFNISYAVLTLLREAIGAPN